MIIQVLLSQEQMLMVIIVNGDGNENGKANHFAVATGAGANFWLTKNFGLGIQGDYVSTPGDKSTVANFWQASASIFQIW
jgi:hypothetical protein